MLKHKRIHAAVGAAVTAAALGVTGVAASAAVARPTRPLVPGHAALPKIFVAMNGKTITVTGAKQSGGVEVVSKVSREPQGDPTFVRLDPGVTVAQLIQAGAGDPNNIALIASVVFSPQANKGTSSAQVNLAPGRYVALDLASNAKIPPHTQFTVTRAASPARLPRPQATVASIEFSFRGPGTLRDGELVRFANHGFLVHMIVAARGRNAADAPQDRRAAEGRQGRPGAAPGHRLLLFRQHPDARFLPAAGHPQPAWLLGAGLLHGHPGPPRAHPARHGTRDPDRQVAGLRGGPARPGPAYGAGPGRASTWLPTSRGCSPGGASLADATAASLRRGPAPAGDVRAQHQRSQPAQPAATAYCCSRRTRAVPAPASGGG